MAFIVSNIIVEIPYQVVTGILIYACFYYPVVGIQSSERQGLVLLYVIQLFIYASSFAQMTIAALLPMLRSIYSAPAPGMTPAEALVLQTLRRVSGLYNADQMCTYSTRDMEVEEIGPAGRKSA